MEASENKEKNKSGKVLENIILFVIFLILGMAVGYFGMTKYLEYKDSEEDKQPINVETGPEDITNSEKYSELITSLTGIINGNPIFYSTAGVTASNMNNTVKLGLIYDELVKKNKGTSETLTSTWYGSGECYNGFIVDKNADASVISNTCTLTRFDKSLFVEESKKMFNDENVSVSDFNPKDGKKCIIDVTNPESIICGNVTQNVLGALESKFTITKVTKDEDGTIVIYEKGYLVDNRSTIKGSNPQYDNYYLHSSDSKNYYYELRNADNLTFKHTFKTDDKTNYYYVSTELEKE